MNRRVHVGRHVTIIGETPQGIHLESTARFRPGQLVELVGEEGRDADTTGRIAYVVSWSVVRLGKDGPVYQGVWRWQ